MANKGTRQIASGDDLKAFEEAEKQGTRALATPEEAKAFEAHPVASGAQPREGPSTLEALLRGAAQGVSLGFGDELAGAVRQQLHPFPDDPDANPWAESARQYREGRDAWRKDNEAAEAAHPVAYGGAQLAGSLAVPVPGPGKVTGVARIGRYALQGAGLGAASAAGSSHADLTTADADQFSRFLRDTGAGAGLGAVAGAAGGKVADKIAAKGIAAQAAAREGQEKLAQKAFGSARSALGGEVSSGSRTLELLEKAASDPSIPEDMSRAAADLLASPEGAALREQVIRSSLGRAPDQLARINNARDAMFEAGEKLAPEALDAATAKRLSLGAASDAVGGRLKTLAQRFGPGIALSALGGQSYGGVGALAGGLLGAGIGAGLGKPGTIIANALKDPAVAYNLSRATEPLARGATQMSETSGGLEPWLRFLDKEQP